MTELQQRLNFDEACKFETNSNQTRRTGLLRHKQMPYLLLESALSLVVLVGVVCNGGTTAATTRGLVVTRRGLVPTVRGLLEGRAATLDHVDVGFSFSLPPAGTVGTVEAALTVAAGAGADAEFDSSRFRAEPSGKRGGAFLGA
jgi:hypothetical protein